MRINLKVTVTQVRATVDNKKLDHFTTIAFHRQMTEAVRVENTFASRRSTVTTAKKTAEWLVIAGLGNYNDVFINPFCDSRFVFHLAHKSDQLEDDTPKVRINRL